MHAGLDPDPHFGSVIPAIHQTSTYAQSAPGAFVEDYDYSRSANPTRVGAGEALGELEGGLGSAFSSGMAATHALITVAAEAGGHIVIPADLYGGTYRLVDKVLTRWGLRYTMVDQTDLDALSAAIERRHEPDLGRDADQPAAERRRRSRASWRASGGALVAVDNTFATPANQLPLQLGADAVVHSTTKYLGGPLGHGRRRGRRARRRAARAGALRAERDRRGAGADGLLPRAPRPAHAARCACSAHARQRRRGQRVPRDVEGAYDVRWPGFGGMVSFRHPDAVRIASSTHIFTLAESLGGVESLIEVPQAMTHQSVEDSDAAVPADLVRLSCGIEAAEDLVADLRRAIG